MSPFFDAWRSAPVESKASIAWEQIASHGLAELFPIPGDDPTDIGAMASAYTDLFQNCTPAEISDWMAWLRALRQAAADQRAILELQSGESA